jgi:hypothetical protein
MSDTDNKQNDNNEEQKQITIHHYNPTFDLCGRLDKEGLFFYFFRKWTQSLAHNKNTYEASQEATKLFDALEKNENLTEEDKLKLFDQLWGSLETLRCTHLNYAKGLKRKQKKWAQYAERLGKDSHRKYWEETSGPKD